MARTVDRPMKVPRDQALARSEICALSPGRFGGVQRALMCLNTLYEQKRGQLVNDWDEDGRITNFIPGNDAYWYVPILGNGAQSEAILPALWVPALAQFGATMTITGGAGSAVWTYPGAVGPGWLAPTANTLTANDTIGAADYQEVKLTPGALWGIQGKVHGVSVGYTRAKTLLSATGAGLTSYAGNSVTPMDGLYSGGEDPLSVARLDDARYMARQIWASRLGPIITKARLKYDMMWPEQQIFIPQSGVNVAFARLEWWADVPQGLTCAGASADDGSLVFDEVTTYTARFWARASAVAGGQTLRITGPQNSVTLPAPWAPGPYVFGPFDLTVAATREQGDAPQPIRFFADDGDTGTGCDLVSFCGYWRIPTIGGR